MPVEASRGLPRNHVAVICIGLVACVIITGFWIGMGGFKEISIVKFGLFIAF